MPHIILEIPRSLAIERDLQDLLRQLHQAVGALPSVQLTDIKSRVHLLDDFRVADGTAQAGSFVHARLIQTKSRSPENQKLMSETVLAILEAFFLEKKPEHQLQ